MLRTIQAERAGWKAERPATPPPDTTQPGMTLDFTAHDMVMPPDPPTPFGPKIGGASIALKIMGPLPDFPDSEAVRRWNEKGVVELEEMNLLWGPLALSAKGALALDDDLQPEGALMGKIGGLAQCVESLTSGGWLNEKQITMVGMMVSVFTKSSGNKGLSSAELPITVQLGGLFLGPVRIFSFPHITWPLPRP
jgi:hypothetical protein